MYINHAVQSGSHRDMPLGAIGSSLRDIYSLRDTLLHRSAAALFQFSSRTFHHSVTARANVVTFTIVSARVLHAKCNHVK